MNPHRRIVAIALPMIISNIAAPLLGLVDTAIIGHLPDAIYLSAVAVGATAMSFIILMCGFLRMTSTATIAQAYGRQDLPRLRAVSQQAVLVALLLGGLMVLLSPLLIAVVQTLYQGSTALKALTASYLQIRLLGAPAALLNLVLLGILLGRQQARAAMQLVIFINAINVIGNLMLIIGLDLHVYGAAWSSVLAEYSVAALGCYWLRDLLQPWLGGQWQLLQQLLRMNGEVFVRSLLLQLSLACMTLYASYYGSDLVAVNALLLQFLLLISLGLDGIAYAVEALIGEAKGRAQGQQIQRWISLGMRWSLSFAVGYALLFWLLGETIIGLLTDLEDLRALATMYLPWLWALPLVAHFAYFYDGVYIGLGATRAMLITMAMAAIMVFFPMLMWVHLGWSNDNANHGLWLALLAFMAARGLFQRLLLNKVVQQ